MSNMSQGAGWWRASDGKWYPPDKHPAAQTGRPCVSCGGGPLVPMEKPITQKKRMKFGFLWVVATILTGGFAIILYLVMPRQVVTVSVDRRLQCGTCRARQL